jgi:mono/diheme cytochrome c family protein
MRSAHERRIVCRRVSRPTPFASLGRTLAPLACAVPLVAGAAGCGGEIEVPEESPLRKGAVLFNERCSGCHTLEAANSYGSKPEGELAETERTNGPNFNVRKVNREDVLFAIRNGGFSGAIMPANIVVGQDAQVVADFLERYSGRKKSSSGQ